MKKIIMCMAIAVAAVCVNAASFSWGAANVFYGDAKADGVTGYLLFVDQLSVADATDALSKGGVDVIKSAAAHTAVVKAGSVSATGTVFDRADATAGNDYSAYFVLFSDDSSSYFMSGVKTVTAKDVGASPFSFANQQSATKGIAWTKVGGTQPGPGGVPEPTSGLLLVLGGAALALRRKQK